MKTKTITLYQFDELPTEKAKDRARDWYREGALDYEWWDHIYDDAEKVGLKITGFGLDRRKHVDGTLEMSGLASCKAIMSEHGESCDTYRLASEYVNRFAGLETEIEKDLDDVSDREDELEQLTNDYTYALREEYASILQQENEYQLSDEQVDESIRANEYDFTEDGKRAQ